MTVVGSGSGSTIRGLIVNGFAQDGIDLEGASITTVEGNFIGTNAAGTAILANGGEGVDINSCVRQYNRRHDSLSRNIISGNTAYGVEIQTASIDNIVEGNYIGTDVTGDSLR